jgi:hypothetical protein
MQVIDGRRKITFTDKYTTSYNKAKGTWGCDCKHGSINSCKLKEHPCRHIKKAQELLKINFI